MKFFNTVHNIYLKLYRSLFSNRFTRPLTFVIDGQTYRNPKIQRVLLFVSFVVIMSFILAPQNKITTVTYTVGDFATKDIKATRDYLIVDKDATEQKQTEAAKEVYPVYDADVTSLVSLFDRIDSSFKHMRDLGGKKPENITTREWFMQNRHLFNELIGVDVPDDVFLRLADAEFDTDIEESVKLLLENLYGLYIVESYTQIIEDIVNTNIVLINSQTKAETILASTDHVVNLNDARDIIAENASTSAPNASRAVLAVAVDFSQILIKPNVTYNPTETENRRNSARESVKPVMISINKGEMIIRDGEKVEKRHVTILDAIIESESDYNIYFAYQGILLLIIIMTYAVYVFSVRNIKKLTLRNKDFLFIGLTLLLFSAFTKIFLFLKDALVDEFILIPEPAYKFILPIVAGAMLVRIVINSESAVIYAVLSSIFTGIMVGGDIFFSVFIFIGSLIGAHLVAQTKQRSTIVYAGLMVGMINVLTIVSIYISRLNLLSQDILTTITTDTKTMVSNIIFGFSAGIISSVVVLGITPLVELLFRYTTDIKLVELSNLEHPLLKEMVIRAPGTYHHSIIVGNLAEAAATAIGSNPLLARVSSYYHDIGKIKKPNYFIENITDGNNPHDRLTPHMSALILISHVKDGVDLARRYRLGQEIIDIIMQHHGTHLISFFHQKALEMAETTKGMTVEEKNFRYPGPKPQTREAGIVLLADNVEAASKVLSDPKPARIESMVQNIIDRIFLDGQLDQCELTLKDLDAITRSFTQVLTGIFHQRIDYPEPVIRETWVEEKPKEQIIGDSAYSNRGSTH
ncbi:MAG: HDIG domain-containing protein [Deltaproteobacteria bacterium]|nr:HDIG domain-containing protein [Candidatus Zymogenaceae bacterium]